MTSNKNQAQRNFDCREEMCTSTNSKAHTMPIDAVRATRDVYSCLLTAESRTADSCQQSSTLGYSAFHSFPDIHC